MGTFLLIWGIGPILSFKIFYQADAAVVAPIAEVALEDNPKLSPEQQRLANGWLPENTSESSAKSQISVYKLSIPKLRIKNALVHIGGNDLTKSLLHWGDSAIPGKIGNGVIFGHSVLPQFYNPKNYISIFSLLPTLEKGDEILVSFDGIDYRYEVDSRKVVKPDDISGLNQDRDDSYLTLVTCVPPGTYLERLWLTAKLVDVTKKSV